MDVDLLRRGGGRRLVEAMRRARLARVPARPWLQTRDPAPPAPKQARSLKRRERLLEAGRRVFGEKGFEGTSIEEITSRAGTAAGAFYQHFSSKHQLLVVLMNDFIERLSRLDLRPEASGDVQAGLHRFLGAAFQVDAAYFGVVRAWQEAALTDADLGRMQSDIEKWTQARVLGVLQQLQQHPRALRDRDLAAFARMMDRHFWSLLARGSRLSARDFNREVALSADVIYHYLFCD
jgi:AcrR family transcriptional regulator